MVRIHEIKHPRYHDQKVLIAKYKVDKDNVIVFTEAQSMPGEYYVSGKEIKKHKITNNGKIDCYAVPLDVLEDISARLDTYPVEYIDYE